MVLFHKRRSDVEEICGNVKEKYMKKKDEELCLFFVISPVLQNTGLFIIHSLQAEVNNRGHAIRNEKERSGSNRKKRRNKGKKCII